MAFADEEGVRYSTAFLGSSAMAGSFDTTQLGNTDAQGIAMAEAIRAYGGDPDAIVSAARAPGDLLAYCELHIEQGPVLERSGVPVGIVTTITGQNQVELVFRGEAGHAGTMPMQRRHDAPWPPPPSGSWAPRRSRAGARIWWPPSAGSAWSRGRGTSSQAPPPCHWTSATPDDATRRAAVDDLRSQAGADRRRPRHARSSGPWWRDSRRCRWTRTWPAGSRRRCARPGRRWRAWPAEPGTTAWRCRALAPVAMLFVRCEGGISHNPAEAVAEADVAVALDVLERFVVSFA